MNRSFADPHKHALILFDGVCNFCNRSVQFIIRRDRNDHFRFASLQSSLAESVLAANYLSASRLDSIVLIEGEQIFTESTAVLRICKKMDGLWKGLYMLIIFPKPIRDALYRWLANNRYHFFGKQDTCMIPTPEIRKRFLHIDKTKEGDSK